MTNRFAKIEADLLLLKWAGPSRRHGGL